MSQTAAEIKPSKKKSTSLATNLYQIFSIAGHRDATPENK